MAKQLTMTLPDAYYAALESKGAPLEQGAAEFLKGWVLACGLGEMPSLKLADLVSTYTKPKGEEAAEVPLMLMGTEGGGADGGE